MSEFQKVEAHDVSYTCDCAEWYEAEDSENSVLVCGSYELDKETQTRLGEVRLYSFQEPCEQEETPGIAKLTLLEKESSSGIFDIKFSQAKLLASATADGMCNLYPLKETSGNSLKQRTSIRLIPEDCDAYCLSLDWNDRKNHQENLSVVVSRSDGYLSVVGVSQSGELTVLNDFLAHEYPYMDSGAEAWITAFDCWNENVVYSGADDGKFKVWDIQSHSQKPVFVNSSTHEAGVCSMQCSVHKENLLVTGSYDGKIRMWDKRNFTSPVCKALDVGGGVWRLKFHPHIEQHHLLLAACMRSGFRVYDTTKLELQGSTTDAVEDLCLLGSFNNGLPKGKWEALGYGVDWITTSRFDEKKALYYIAGSSFYDHTLRLFQWNK